METAAEKLSIEVSDKAVEHVNRFMEKEGAQGHVLRVGVKGGGCSGLSYVLQFEGEERINPTDGRGVRKRRHPCGRWTRRAFFSWRAPRWISKTG